MDDVTAFMEGRNQLLAGIAEKVLSAVRREVEEKGLKLEGRKEGKSQVIASCTCVEERFHECSKRRGSRSCNPCGNTGSAVANEDEEVGSEGEGKAEMVRCAILPRQEESFH